jgi:hypothetical protein
VQESFQVVVNNPYIMAWDKNLSGVEWSDGVEWSGVMKWSGEKV